MEELNIHIGTDLYQYMHMSVSKTEAEDFLDMSKKEYPDDKYIIIEYPPLEGLPSGSSSHENRFVVYVKIKK